MIQCVNEVQLYFLVSLATGIALLVEAANANALSEMLGAPLSLSLFSSSFFTDA